MLGPAPVLHIERYQTASPWALRDGFVIAIMTIVMCVHKSVISPFDREAGFF